MKTINAEMTFGEIIFLIYQYKKSRDYARDCRYNIRKRIDVHGRDNVIVGDNITDGERFDRQDEAYKFANSRIRYYRKLSHQIPRGWNSDMENLDES